MENGVPGALRGRSASKTLYSIEGRRVLLEVVVRAAVKGAARGGAGGVSIINSWNSARRRGEIKLHHGGRDEAAKIMIICIDEYNDGYGCRI